MEQDLYQFKTAFEHHNQLKHYEIFKRLVTVFKQQCEINETIDKNPEIIIKEKPDSDTICTPHIEAQYVRQGKQRVTGDKGFVTETCDADNKTQFITDIEVTESTEHDSKQQPQIQQRLTEHEFKPEHQYEDAGFVMGKSS
jgi:hypothetical protein